MTTTGRPSKLTPEVQVKIVTAIKVGNYADTAAEAAGIHRATFFAWMAKGKVAKSGPYRDFYDAIKSASAEAEVVAVGLVRSAWKDDWRSAMTYLERRNPKRWGRRDHRTLEVKDWREQAKKDGHDPDALLRTAADALKEQMRAAMKSGAVVVAGGEAATGKGE